ncbi:MAG: NAD(P)H-dependent oxidoreductase [Saprospiraceae bacterium]|nr:NAD(P)H-dependent oxidoreductase [Saprospiraceae bacterium]
MPLLIISGTNRKDSSSLLISKLICEILTLKNIKFTFVNLEDFTDSISDKDQYSSLNEAGLLAKFQDDVLIPATKIILIVPEYNGSFPGFLKWWIDTLSIRKPTESFKFKKIALIGISDGINGNVRGVDHLMSICRYLKMIIYPGFVYFPNINKVLDLWLENPKHAKRIESLVEEFEKF